MLPRIRSIIRLALILRIKIHRIAIKIRLKFSTILSIQKPTSIMFMVYVIRCQLDPYYSTNIWIE